MTLNDVHARSVARGPVVRAVVLALFLAGLYACPAGAIDMPAPLSVDSANSMDGDRAARPQRVLGLNCVAGARIYAIDRLTIVNASGEIPSGRRDAALSRQPVANTAAAGGGGSDVVVNGTFFATRLGNSVPLGPVIRGGTADHDRYPGEAYGRGAVAMRADGRIIVGRAAGAGQSEIDWRFGDGPGNPVKAAMGGGALLIENGISLQWPDLRDEQKFTGSLQTNQFRKACHSLIGIRDGQAYLIFVEDDYGDTVQTKFAAAGFTALVKFDGGGACYLRDHDFSEPGGERTHKSEYNPTGLAAVVRRREMAIQRLDPCKTPNTALPGDNPLVDGVALSACFNGAQCSGRDAGKQPAEAYCRKQGQPAARSWRVVAGTVLSRDMGSGRIKDIGNPVVTALACGATCPDGSPPGPNGRCAEPPVAGGLLSTDTWAGLWKCESNRWGRYDLKIEGAGTASTIIGHQPNAGPYVYRVASVNAAKTGAEGTFELLEGRNGPAVAHGHWNFSVVGSKMLDTTHQREDNNQRFQYLCKRAASGATGTSPAPPAPAPTVTPPQPRVTPPQPRVTPPQRPTAPPAGTWTPIN